MLLFRLIIEKGLGKWRKLGLHSFQMAIDMKARFMRAFAEAVGFAHGHLYYFALMAIGVMAILMPYRH